MQAVAPAKETRIIIINIIMIIIIIIAIAMDETIVI
jgi:hypothetical protein